MTPTSTTVSEPERTLENAVLTHHFTPSTLTHPTVDGRVSDKAWVGEDTSSLSTVSLLESILTRERFQQSIAKGNVSVERLPNKYGCFLPSSKEPQTKRLGRTLLGVQGTMCQEQRHAGPV